jgi:hypothetical protein
VDHFEPGAPFAHLAETAYPYAGLELGLLAAREIKEAQGQLAAAVADAYQQVAAAAKRRFCQQDLARNEAALAGNNCAELYELRPVLVPQRQQEQQVLDTEKTEPLELFRERRPDTGEGGQRRVGFQRHRVIASIASASTSTSLGNDATPTAARAGNGFLK